MNIAVLRSRFLNKTVSPREWAQTVVRQIEHEGERYHGLTHFDPSQFLAEAEQSEQRFQKGQPKGPLDGIPIGLKDLIETQDMPTTGGSAILDGYRPKADAEVVRRLKDAGANVAVGKLNLHEFAYGTTGTSSYFGPCKNPWDLRRMAGGSSSGTAIAVQRNWVMGGLGTDTGGSIRIPAALSGVTGLKPTYGRVSTQGVIPLAWSLDHVGPMARSALDVREIFNVIRDADPEALTPVQPKRYRVLWPKNLGKVYTAAIDGLTVEAVETLNEAGVITVAEDLLPGWEELLLLQHILVGAEASAFHWAWLQNRAHLYQADVRERLQTRASVLAVQYIEALRRRQHLIEEYQPLWQRWDAIVLPTVPMTAPLLDDLEIENDQGVLEDVRVSLVKFTAPFNVLGFPAISHPIGFEQGLPVGLQWVAADNREDVLLDIVAKYQILTDWHSTLPVDLI